MAIEQSRAVGIEEIPVIDIGALGADTQAEIEVFRQMRRAAESVGFFYIANHGVPDSAVRSIMSEARRFFALPVEERQAIGLTRSHCFRGYLEIGERGTNQKRSPDILEALNLGPDLGPDDPAVRAGKPLHGPNQWPNLPGFRDSILAYQAHMDVLAARLLTAMSSVLGVSAEDHVRIFERPLTQMRLLHYPPQPPSVDNMMGARPHQDTSYLTILLQDDIGGLEVQAPSGDWIQAPPRPDMFVVNVGEFLELMASGTFSSAMHRVVNRTGRERFSVPYFVSPDFDAVIAPLPNFVTSTGARTFEPTHVGDYMYGFFRSLWPSVGAA